MNPATLAKIPMIIKKGKNAWQATKTILVLGGRRWGTKIKNFLYLGGNSYLYDKWYDKGLEEKGKYTQNEIEGYKKKTSKKNVNRAGFLMHSEAKVFVFANPLNYENIINNYRNRGVMTRIFVNRLNKVLDKEQISGSDIIAFRDINHLKRSGIIPKSDIFYKVLLRNGSFFLFSGQNFFFVYIVGNTSNVFKIIKNYFIRIIPSLQKEIEKEKDSITKIKELLRIKKLSPIEKINQEKFEFITFPTLGQ
jgi:hypothetical protein